MDLEAQIINFLEGATEPTPTIKIAKQFYGDEGRRKIINPTLYKMAKEGKLVKIAEANGAKPRWSLKPVPPAEITSEVTCEKLLGSSDV